MTSRPRERPRPVAGRVVKVDQIPNADHVQLVRVDVGSEDPLVIVFGGTRTLSEGEVVPVAPPGSRVPGPAGDREQPVKMRRRRYRGHDSYGMLCSLKELGWAKSGDQVAVLRHDLPAGYVLPYATGWRHLVIDPHPGQFAQNTIEADVGSVRDEYAADWPAGGQLSASSASTRWATAKARLAAGTPA